MKQQQQPPRQKPANNKQWPQNRGHQPRLKGQDLEKILKSL